MMKSKADVTDAFVWMWLPGETKPVVTGRLAEDAARLTFTYDASYLGRKNAIPIYEPELPLGKGTIKPIESLSMASCIRDGSPDAWGRRAVINRLAGGNPNAVGIPEPSELTFLLKSGSDRIGSLDFQASATEYVPRLPTQASLEEIMEAVVLIEKGVALPPVLDQAINYRTSIGGARPKALIDDGTTKLIAKFSTINEPFNFVKAEFIAMTLARACGLNTAAVTMNDTAGKDILLIERFDRQLTNDGWTRRSVVSALTLLGLDEMLARYASYADLANIVTHRFTDPKDTLKELYGRMCFNVLSGNNDDHARNHAAFWDGDMLTLTPAYDICPQVRTGNEATQAMLINGDNRASTLSNLLSAASAFRLETSEAVAMIERQIAIIAGVWREVCAQADLSPVDRELFAGRQFLNEYAIEGLDAHTALRGAFHEARNALVGN